MVGTACNRDTLGVARVAGRRGRQPGPAGLGSSATTAVVVGGGEGGCPPPHSQQMPLNKEPGTAWKIPWDFGGSPPKADIRRGQGLDWPKRI